MSTVGAISGSLATHLLVRRREEVDHPARRERDLADGFGGPDGERAEEISGWAHAATVDLAADTHQSPAVLHLGSDPRCNTGKGQRGAVAKSTRPSATRLATMRAVEVRHAARSIAERLQHESTSLAVAAVERCLAGADPCRPDGGVGFRVGRHGARRTTRRSGSRSHARRGPAHRGAEIHQHLVPDPAVRRSARLRRRPPGLASASAARPAVRASTRAMLVSTTADVALEREREHRPSRVRTDPRAAPAARRGRRARRPSWRSTITAGSGAQVAGPARIAEALPQPQDIAERRGGARRGVGIGVEERRATSGSTRSAWVCCSITSATRIAHGSRVARHGRSRSCGTPHARTAPASITARADVSRPRRRCRRRGACARERTRASRPSPCGGSSTPPCRPG